MEMESILFFMQIDEWNGRVLLAHQCLLQPLFLWIRLQKVGTCTRQNQSSLSYATSQSTFIIFYTLNFTIYLPHHGAHALFYFLSMNDVYHGSSPYMQGLTSYHKSQNMQTHCKFCIHLIMHCIFVYDKMLVPPYSKTIYLVCA